MLSDKELFESLDLDLPELSSVKSAVEDGKLEEAKRALGTYIRSRETPGWLVPAREDEKGERTVFVGHKEK